MKYIEHSKMLLKNQGYRLTEARCGVLKVIDESMLPLNAYGAAEAVRANGNAVDTVTVYRILEVLEKLKLVHQVRGGYMACRDFECLNSEQCHHQFVCEQCKTVKEIHISDADFLGEINKKFPDLNFQSHYFEFSGLCGTCKN